MIVAEIFSRFNLRQLSVFVCVAECGGIREAARRLSLTQPAITYAMRELEQGLGATLFSRSVKGVALTDAGEVFFLRAKRILGEAQSTGEEMEQWGNLQAGRICIALSAVAATTLLPPALTAFRKERPNVQVVLKELTWPEHTDGWQDGEYDFALLAEAAPPHHDALEREALLTFDAALAVREGHPLHVARSFSDLSETTWLAPVYGMEVLNALFEKAEQAPPKDVIYCHSVAIALALLRQTEAIAVVSAAMFADEVASRGLVQLVLEEALPKVVLSLVIRDHQVLTPNARLFMKCLRSEAFKGIA